MGTSKARLDWGGTSLLRSQIAALTEAGAAQVIAVVSAVDADLVEAPAVPIRNLHPERGRTHSLRLGLSALEPCAAILLVSVDQPRGPALLTNLVDAHFGNERAITIPVHRGRRGHPVVYSRSLLAEMLAASEEKEGLRGIVRADRARIAEWETDDPTVGLDLNTPDEYERARPR
jgi:CTP:molybdopterin cytidylyltransferase MocA